jgi:hypothetical protein
MNSRKEPMSVAKLVKAFQAGSLLRNDEYQRGEAWTPVQKATFVDSIFRKYPVPALFLHRIESPGLEGEAAVRYEVIDGQQRLVALRDYFEGKYPVPTLTGDSRLRLPRVVREMFAPWSGKSYPELSAELKAQYDSTEMTVFLIEPNAHPEEIRDLFIRLQSGTALTRQQVRDAWPGNLGPYIVELAGKLDRRPAVNLFHVIDKRGSRSDDDGRDTHAQDRLMCAQLLRVFLGRERDLHGCPSVTANYLDALYHEHTDFDSRGSEGARFRKILEHVADIFERARRHSGRKVFRRLDVIAAMMYLQDATRNALFQTNAGTMDAIAKNIADSVDGEPVKASGGRSTLGSTLKAHYDWWRDNVCKNAGIRLDPKRLFDDADRLRIRERDAGCCRICNQPVEPSEEEYDHFPTPHRDGGATVVENGRLVHRQCHPRGRPPMER